MNEIIPNALYTVAGSWAPFFTIMPFYHDKLEEETWKCIRLDRDGSPFDVKVHSTNLIPATRDDFPGYEFPELFQETSHPAPHPLYYMKVNQWGDWEVFVAGTSIGVYNEPRAGEILNLLKVAHKIPGFVNND